MNDERKHKNKSPLIARTLLKLFLRSDLKEQRLGDYEEIYQYKADREGIVKAKLWYWVQTIRSIPKLIYDSIYWGTAMISNYLKIAFRNFRKHKVNSFINMFSLVVGIVSCVLITLWAIDELSYDKFHNEPDTIYQVLVDTDKGPVSSTPVLLAETLLNESPEIVAYSRYHWLWGGALINYGDKSFYENELRLVDPGFLKMFKFPFIQGNPQTVLSNPHSMVITKSIADKYFGNEDPIGKTILLNKEDIFTITGVLEDVPKNSTLGFEILIPIQYNIDKQKQWYSAWNNLFVMTFIKTREGISSRQLNEKILNTIPQNGGAKNAKISLLSFADRYFQFFSDIDDIYIYSTIAFLILLIASINFINLSTASALKRSKEIGLRKVIGANRKNIMVQFFGETLLIIIGAFVISMIIVLLFLPTFNALVNKELVLNNWLVIGITFLFTLITGITAILYPAVFVSSFKPTNALQEKSQPGKSKYFFRKALIVIQFTFSIMLLVGVITVSSQINFLSSKDIGYKKDNMVKIEAKGGSEEYYSLFKNSLEQNPQVLGVTGSYVGLPFFTWNITGFNWEGKDPNEHMSIAYNIVGYDFTKTFNTKMIDGRDFSKEFPSDVEHGVLINEEMAKLMGKEAAVGQVITKGNESYTVVGVLTNFHFNSFESKISPLILGLKPNALKNIYVKVNGRDFATTFNYIKNTWEKIAPSFPFEYSMVDEEFNISFEDTEQTAGLLDSFAIIALIISCLGLLGLSAFSTEQRTKEIGIRKVLGSSSRSILFLLIKEYLVSLIIASAVAYPISYYLMSGWLENFAYRININFLPFVIATIVAVVISLATVSYQSIKAATANPIDSIKYE